FLLVALDRPIALSDQQFGSRPNSWRHQRDNHSLYVAEQRAFRPNEREANPYRHTFVANGSRLPGVRNIASTDPHNRGAIPCPDRTLLLLRPFLVDADAFSHRPGGCHWSSAGRDHRQCRWIPRTRIDWLPQKSDRNTYHRLHSPRCGCARRWIALL